MGGPVSAIIPSVFTCTCTAKSIVRVITFCKYTLAIIRATLEWGWNSSLCYYLNKYSKIIYYVVDLLPINESDRLPWNLRTLSLCSFWAFSLASFFPLSNSGRYSSPGITAFLVKCILLLSTHVHDHAAVAILVWQCILLQIMSYYLLKNEKYIRGSGHTSTWQYLPLSSFLFAKLAFRGPLMRNQTCLTATSKAKTRNTENPYLSSCLGLSQ